MVVFFYRREPFLMSSFIAEPLLRIDNFNATHSVLGLFTTETTDQRDFEILILMRRAVLIFIITYILNIMRYGCILVSGSVESSLSRYFVFVDI